MGAAFSTKIILLISVIACITIIITVMIGYIGLYCCSKGFLTAYKVFAGIGVLLDMVMICIMGISVIEKQYKYSCGNLVLYILLLINNISAIVYTSEY